MTESITRGVLSAFDSYPPGKIEFHYEYMDTKRFSGEEYWELLYSLYHTKYADRPLDLIISADDDAFNFLMRYGEQLFPDTPVVFCGVNADPYDIQKTNKSITGLFETIDLRGTIDLILRLHPETSRLAVIVDNTTTGLLLQSQLQRVQTDYQERLAFDLISDLTMSDLLKAVAALDEKTVILYLGFFQDSDGVFYNTQTSLAEIAPKAIVPIYTVWDFSAEDEVVGGSIIKGEDLGKTAGEMALRILNGVDPRHIPVIMQSRYVYFFSWEALERWDIAESGLPSGSIIHNKPVSIFTQYRYQVFGSLAFVLLQSLIIAYLMVNRTRRLKVEQALRVSEARKRAILEAVPDMMFLVRRDGTYLDFHAPNPIIEKLLAPPDQFLGKTQREFLSPELYDLFVPTHQKAYETGKVQALVYPLTLSGKQHYFEARVVPCDPDTTLTMVRDITERITYEEKIKSQLEQLAALRTIDASITGSTELYPTLEVILNQVFDLLQADAADIFLFEPKTRVLEFGAGRGFRSEMVNQVSYTSQHTIAYQAATEKKFIAIPDLENSREALKDLPLFKAEGFRAYFGAPLIAKGEVNGVLEVFLHKARNPQTDWLNFFESLAAQAAIAIDNVKLFEGLEYSNLELNEAYEATLEGWALALELRDQETQGHARRVTDMCLQLAQEMQMSEEEQVHLRRGALLHDIGKMGIPDRILSKPGPLTEQEWEIMRQHPVYAYKLLAGIPYLQPALDVPYCHHERWDGSGYPRGLKGAEIPLSARIFTVVDVWDALISDRPYRPAWPATKALDYLRHQSGIHFDPRVVEKFLSIVKDYVSLA